MSIQNIVRSSTSSNDGNVFDGQLIHFTTNLPHHIERMIVSFLTDKNGQMELFTDLRQKLLVNVDVVSGLGSDRTPQEQQQDHRKTKLPTEIDL